MADIAEIEWSSCSEGSSSYALVDKAGRRIEITPNYGNPVEKFVKALKTLNRDIEEIHV